MSPSGPLRVAFRADASVSIGSGHVMRCLTLAEALRARGADCLFLSRPHPGHLLDVIAGRGHRVMALPPPPAIAGEGGHAGWLGVPWQEDATDSLEALTRAGGGVPVDWLVVDHYALGAGWESRLRPLGRRILVLDDLANRAHDCDLLLDQALGHGPAEYAPNLAPGIPVLTGPQHVLLRREFAARRGESLSARRHRPPRHVLVAMGGMDPDNALGGIVSALSTLPQAAGVQVSLVISGAAPHLPKLRATVATAPIDLRLCVDHRDMAGLMVEADVAISASGLTAYELACMGVPMVLLPMSPIQASVARELAAITTALPVEGWQDDIPGRVGRALSALLTRLESGERPTASEAFDGRGVERLLDAMSRIGQALPG